MSFAGWDVESQPAAVPQRAPVDQLLHETGTTLSAFASAVQRLSGLTAQLGGRRDGGGLRTRIEDTLGLCAQYEETLRGLTEQVAVVLSGLLGSLEALVRQRATQEKLRREFNALVGVYVGVRSEYNTSKGVYRVPEEPPAAADSAAGDTASTPLLQTQAQTYSLAQLEAEYHAQLAAAREAEITRIQQGVQEVNTIFRDLLVLVRQQGEQVDTVEENMNVVLNNNIVATQELAKAERYQRLKLRCGIVSLVAMIVVTLVVLAVLS